ncbi:DUF2817 domain-containing protein [Mucilaginibacter xinganensis]|uniref:DUF4157 domain-containing protein n=1 Tax=Mucilaginibacter xinganensis TaxID=1234841 RepID=A0A223NVN1_9SPHI|nr:DUF2817 domain-containing protein [Mucilaginibacter xinganensis]ASU33917.1 hypothetical protein MuYL_2025 [Mucilaginibacter xinganensis]
MQETKSIANKSPNSPAASAGKATPALQVLEQDSGFNDRLPIQLKLTVGAANDPLEHEADAMADKVMRTPETSFIQRKSECSCGGVDDERVHLKPLVSQITPFIQAKGYGAGTVSNAVSGKIKSSMGGGSPIQSDTRSFMESRFGADFGNVKIHTGIGPAQLNRALNAKAFTVSNNIFFNSGQYQPETDSGKHLLAHELTHVVQQNKTENFIARQVINLNDVDRDFKNRKLTTSSGVAGFGATRGKTMEPPTEDQDLPIDAFFFLENNTPPAAAPPATSPPAVAPPTGEIKDAGAEDISGTPKPGAPAQQAAVVQPPAKPIERALIIGSIHGDEGGKSGSSVLGEQLKTELGGQLKRDFDVIMVPMVNPGGTKDNTRNNRRDVDLNRNFPGLSNAAPVPAGKKFPPEQPEVKAIKNIISVLHPARILSLHTVKNQNEGGFYADPVEGEAREIACEMAISVLNASPANEINVRGNEIAHGVCGARYPGGAEVSVTTGQSSLGSWASAPASAGGGGNIPVVTHEIADPLVNGKRVPLATSGDGRTRDALMTGLRPFLLDRQKNPSQASALLQAKVTPTFLTGRHTAADLELLAAIKRIVNSRFADMNVFYKSVWLPAQPTDVKSVLPSNLSKASFERNFTTQGGIVGREMHGLTGKSSDSDIETEVLRIMQTRSMPGFSRHHWGTEIDVVSATRTDWTGNGRFVKMIPFLQQHSQQFGFFNPYTTGFSGQSGFPDPTQRHYEEEPWHISYFPIANVLQAEWARTFQAQGINAAAPTALDALITDTAIKIATGSGVSAATMERVLKQIGLRDFQTNVAPAP